MYQFGVKLIQGDDGRVTATLLDFRTGPSGEGASAEEAYRDLIAKTSSGLTKFLAGGGRPTPVTEGTPTISIALPAPARAASSAPRPAAAAKGQRIGARQGGHSWNYAWHSNTISTEG